MTESITISRSSPKSAVNRKRQHNYLLIGIVANLTLWGSALLYIKLTPVTYTSESAITLPGVGSATHVSLPGIGQASYENSSPYASNNQDPREDYKFISRSEPVLRAAAAKLNMSLKKFGKPRVKIVDNTTIMTVDFKGATPQEAQNKSLAFYQALEVKLNELRAQEVTRRDVGFQTSLGSSQKKLEIAQKRLSDYKSSSGLNSSDQIKELSSSIEQLRRQRAELLAQQQQASTSQRKLSSSLNLSDKQAVDAFAIQSDQIFQQNLKTYSESSAALATLGSKYLPNHPTVVAEKAKQNAAQTALLKRSQSLLGRTVSQGTLQKFNLSSTSSGSARENLFQQLVTVQAEQQGLQAQAGAINRQITQLEDRLNNMAQQESTLDALKRDLQVAEAVFSSTLTRLDVGKSNLFGSYPLAQTLTKPTLPETPSSPKTELALLGTALGSVFLTSALMSLWQRERKSWKREQPVNIQRKKMGL